MTSTIAEKDHREKAAAHIAFFANAEPLIRAINNGLLFAGKDGTLPALTTIKFEFDGETLTAATTDRYRLCVETIELDRAIDHSGQPEFTFLLQTSYAKQALAVLKANKRDKVLLAVDETGVELRFFEQTARYPIDTDHTFPAYRALIPNPDDAQPRDRVMFNPAILVDLAKVQTEKPKGHDELDIRLFGTNDQPKASLVQFTDGPTVVVMPLRPHN